MNLKWEIRQNRRKIIIIFVLLILTAIFLAIYFPYYSSMVESGFIETQPERFQQEFRLQKNFSYFIASNWFDKNLFEFAGILAVLLAIGAVADDQENNLLGLYFTRYSRWKYFISKVLSHLTVIFISGFIAHLFLIIFSEVSGYDIDFFRFNIGYLLSFIRFCFIYSTGLLISTISRNKFLTGAVTFALIIGILYLTPDLLNIFSYMNISSYYCGASFPLSGLLLSSFITVLLFFLYYLRLRKLEL
ncbi:MAG: ABC transporter permease subunit [Halothermotrichaceae bacterium]